MDLYDAYFAYTNETEAPKIYHRWSLTTSIGALLGRTLYVNHGHSRHFPNVYCMCLGEPGARKSTAIKLAKKLIRLAGYETFAADRSSREKFLLDLDGSDTDESNAVNGNGNSKSNYDAMLEKNLWGGDDVSLKEPREVFIVADEFNEFAGAGNLTFFTTLGNLWDWDDETTSYADKVKNSKSVSIYQPTVSMLGGNTPDNFARAFPTELMGQGFLSRMLLIHGEPTGKKIAWPPVPLQEDTDALVSLLRAIKQTNQNGEVKLTKEAKRLCEEIYTQSQPIEDRRFATYSGRRFTQLLKLSISVMAAKFKNEIDEEVIIYTNTMLSAAELLMPKAIGEFGKSKNSDVTNKIMEMLYAASKPVTIKDIFKSVVQDIKMTELAEIMRSLQISEKVQLVTIPGVHGFLPIQKPLVTPKYVDFSLLTEEERMML